MRTPVELARMSSDDHWNGGNAWRVFDLFASEVSGVFDAVLPAIPTCSRK